MGRNINAASFRAGLKAPRLTENGCSATLNGEALPILSADAGQMNLQIPFNFIGRATLMVVTRNGTAQTVIQVAPIAPQFFLNADGSVVATHSDGSPVSATSPARSLETVTLSLTGLGAVSQSVEAGVVPPPGVIALAAVQVRIGGVAVSSPPALLSISSPGTYLIQVQIPPGIGGLVTVQANANGVASNASSLWVLRLS